MDQVRNRFFYAAGLAALGVASLRHRTRGYRRPTAFVPTDHGQSVTHVREIVEDWRSSLVRFHGDVGIRDCDVLELGPGATLGTGVLLAGLGARSYLAVDRFPLSQTTPAAFYEALVASAPLTGSDPERLRAAADAVIAHATDPVAYAADPAFDIRRAAGERSFDLIVSNAAFEHFDDVDAVIEAVSALARPGARFLAMIDFQTHSRGIRTRDPNGIYRYGSRLYRSLSFPGQPNRCRPERYVAALERCGWIGATVTPVDVADPGYAAWSRAGLAPEYRSADAQMDILTGIVLARRPIDDGHAPRG